MPYSGTVLTYYFTPEIHRMARETGIPPLVICPSYRSHPLFFSLPRTAYIHLAHDGLRCRQDHFIQNALYSYLYSGTGSVIQLFQSFLVSSSLPSRILCPGGAKLLVAEF